MFGFWISEIGSVRFNSSVLPRKHAVRLRSAISGEVINQDTDVRHTPV